MSITRRTQRIRRHPKRVIWLKLLCLFTVAAFGVMLFRSPVVAKYLPWEEESSSSGAASAWIDAPFIDQRDKYPTGCESVTAVMALQYAGVDISVEDFIDNYLPQGNAPYTDGTGRLVGANPWKMFLGSPYSESGWGCYAPVIAGALEQVLQDRDVTGLKVKELRDMELPALCEEYVNQGTPVILWTTIDMAEPTESTRFYLEDTGEPFTWIYPLHCLLLTGEDQDSYYFNDPLVGKKVAYPKEQVEEAYRGVGMQAVVLE